MTEAEWYFYATPSPMLEHLGGRASERKLLLFECACHHRRLRHTPDEPLQRLTQRLTEAMENYADGLIPFKQLAATPGAVSAGRERMISPYTHTAAAAAAASVSSAVSGPDYYWELQAQAELVRDIFGNPFRPVTVNPALLAWAGGTLPSLARAIYDERAFDRMPILADALEDAGCADVAVLRHCRGPGVHVRGCWVVDLLLDKS